jgi:hypothetical protein
VADVDGDGVDELFVRSPQWAGVLRWRADTADFACDWISGDPAANANWIDGWQLGPLIDGHCIITTTKKLAAGSHSIR